MNKTSETSSEDFTAFSEIVVPPECKVVFYNDDYTPMDFVVDVLKAIFNKSEADAQSTMLEVHNNGSAVAGTYTYDIAVSKANITKNIARQNKFPLRVEVE